MNRLVIALPFYADDRAKAMRLARFIAKIEPKFRPDVELCFVNRQDCPEVTAWELHDFITTFKTSWFTTPTKGTGHPAGCNAMARDFFEESLRRVKDGRWADVSSVLFMEPDCVPVARDWIDQLKAEWEGLITPFGFLAVGCYRNKNVDVPHVNGNALWHPELARLIDMTVDYQGMGWDSAIATQIEARFVNTPLISNLWRETHVTDARLAVNPFVPPGSRPPVLIHGVQDGSAWAYAERMMAA